MRTEARERVHHSVQLWRVHKASRWVRRYYMKMKHATWYTFSAGEPRRTRIIEEDGGQQWMRVWF